MSKESCTCTSLSKTLGTPKYAISRVISALEADGYLIKNSVRTYILTEQGKKKAEYYSERLDIAVNHLIYEGVPEAQAKLDAFYITKYCSEEMFYALRQLDQKNKLKLIFKNRFSFTGDTLCKHLSDGLYKFSFIVYRDNFKNGEIISIANSGLEHPCNLIVNNGIGSVNLKAVSIIRNSETSGLNFTDKIIGLKYFCDNKYIDAEIIGDSISFPADALNFLSVNSGNGCMLYGSISFKIAYSVEAEKTVIFSTVI